MKKTNDSETKTARAVISYVGDLVDPALADIKRNHDFKGSVFHTARWDQDFNLKGKKITVIGT